VQKNKDLAKKVLEEALVKDKVSVALLSLNI